MISADQEFEAIRTKIDQLVPIIESHADAAEKQRRLSNVVARSMAAAGLYRVATPRSLNGAEAHPITQIKTIEAVSAIHGSTGWNLMIGIEVMGMLGAVYDRAVTAELYSNPDLIISGALNPLGKAVRHEGGYRITGQWPFASGVHNAHYFWSQSVVHEDGEPLHEDGELVFCEHMVPAEQIEILDTFRPLYPTKAALDLDDAAYPESWTAEHHPKTAGNHHPDGKQKAPARTVAEAVDTSG